MGMVLQLNIRNTFMSVITSPYNTYAGYFKMIGTIKQLLELDSIAIAFRNNSNELILALNDKSGERQESLDQFDLDLLLHAATTHTECMIKEIKAQLVVRIASDDSESGYVVMGKAKGISRVETDAVTAAFAIFASQSALRGRQIADELQRIKAQKALEKSEASLRNFFDNSSDMIYISTAEDYIVFINDAGLDILGLDERSEIEGHLFSDFLDRSIVRNELKKNGASVNREILVNNRKKGMLYCIESAHIIRDANGTVHEIQGTIKNISDRIKYEQKLMKANIELGNANEQLKQAQVLLVQQEKMASIGYLAAGIAHEINNPLSFVKANHEHIIKYAMQFRRAFMEASELNPEAMAGIASKYDLDFIFQDLAVMLDQTSEGMKRIIDTISSLKSFSRIENESEKTPCDINECISSTVKLCHNEVKYIADIDLDLGKIPLVLAHKNELNQVFLNIIINAAQAIESNQDADKKGLITITTRQNDDSVTITFDDNGPGIPDKVKLKIFDPFFTTKAPGKGTGLGLSISYDIITRKHGGKIDILDNQPRGARFSIQLPSQAE
jgi:PAS domain S-box-containing protein